jgi:hypothetical protein
VERIAEVDRTQAGGYNIYEITLVGNYPLLLSFGGDPTDYMGLSGKGLTRLSPGTRAA